MRVPWKICGTVGLALGAFALGTSLDIGKPADADQYACVKGTPEIVVDVNGKRPTMRGGRTIAELESIKGSTRFEDMPRSIGLTVARPHIRTRGSVLTVRRRDGSACAYPDEVTVTISLTRHDVYVARRYRPGSCEYAAIRKHEMKHVRANNAVMEKHRSRIREAVSRAAKRGPELASTVERAKTALIQRLQDSAMRAAESMERERTRLHDRIDTRSEYERVRSQCSNWN